MKNILFIVENLRGGGAEKVLLTLLRHFDYQQYDITLCVAYPEGTYLNVIPPSVKIIFLYDKCHSFCRKAFRYYKRYRFSWMLRHQLCKKIGKDYDVIISFLEGRALVLHSLLKDRGRKHITWVHCDLSTYHWTKAAFFSFVQEQKCYQQMDRIVFVSHAAQEGFQKMFVNSVPQLCIYNPIDIANIQSLALEHTVSKRAFTVTAIGTINKVKAIDKLIYAARKFRDLDMPICFQIIGEEDKGQELQSLCKKMGVYDQFFFLGFQSNPYPYLKASDLYVSTSLSEGFSLTICEAMSLGIPVIATPTAGAVEVLEQGEYGLLVTHDEDSIFRGIKKMYEDQNLRETYARKALQRVERFRVEGVMAEIVQLLNN